MCMNYALLAKKELAMEFHLRTMTQFDESAHFVPNRPAPIIASDSPGELVLARFGLVPSWSICPAHKMSLYNARAETLPEKPAFRKLLETRRCIIPATGFYEWKKTKDAAGKETKEPYLFSYTASKTGIFAFAGLWDEWASPGGEKLRSFAIITTEPNETVADVHNRMPVIISPPQARQWLEKPDLALLKPIAGNALSCRKI